MFLRILTLGLPFLFLTPGVLANEGEQLFNSMCVACHTINGPETVGPKLKGITSRKSEQWLIGFIKSPQKYINGNDEYAKALYEKYRKVLMPDQALSDAQIKAILAYVETDTGAGSAANSDGDGQAAEAQEFQASEEDILKGQDLFQGKIRFANGAAACNACHDVKNDAVIGGGVLARELTTVFSRMGQGGVKAILAAPPFPVMQQAYKDKDLTEDEIHALIAFLQNTDQNHYEQPKDYGMGLFIAGLIGTAILFLLYSLIWSKRKKGTVYREIFDRQSKSTWE